MMTDPPNLIECGGRGVRSDGHPLGPPCGRRFEPAGLADLVEQARVAGWRIGPRKPDGTYDAYCDRCARPDPATVAAIRAIEKGLPA